MIKPVVLVTGASSQVGYFLLPHLVAAGYVIHAVSRQAIPALATANVVWHQVNSPRELAEVIVQCQPSFWIQAAPIWLLQEWLPALHPMSTSIQQVVAVSSTSLITKQNSSNALEQQTVQRLLAAEQLLIHQSAWPWTILRPTLLYGCGRDKNITVIARLIRRFRCFPLLGAGNGLRQPLHVDDLALACVQVLNRPQCHNKIYHLAGASTLTYRQMVTEVFAALQQVPCFIALPLPLLKMVVSGMAWLPAYRHLNHAMVSRMNQDLCFDCQAARHDFAFSPRTFGLDPASLANHS